MLRSKSSPKRSRPAKAAATSLDLRQQSLREKEEQLLKKEAELKRLIDDAPRLKEEQTRRRREQLAADPRLSRTTLVDKRRYHASVTADGAVGGRRLRSEKRDGKWMFIFLCALLTVIVFWFCQFFISHI
ncbi:MAG: hypothetical protein WCP06_10155 [Verrucomicrobiota bacterium]